MGTVRRARPRANIDPASCAAISGDANSCISLRDIDFSNAHRFPAWRCQHVQYLRCVEFILRKGAARTTTSLADRCGNRGIGVDDDDLGRKPTVFDDCSTGPIYRTRPSKLLTYWPTTTRAAAISGVTLASTLPTDRCGWRAAQAASRRLLPRAETLLAPRRTRARRFCRPGSNGEQRRRR